MKIALFSDTYAPEINGVAMSVRMLHEGLVERGHDVHVFAPYNPEGAKDPSIVRIPSLPIYIIPNRLATPLVPGLLSRIGEEDFDIIHTHTEFGVGSYGFRAHGKYEVPLVHTYHTVWEDYTHYVALKPFDPAAKRIVRIAARETASRTTRVIAPTKKTHDLLRSYGINEPIDIIPTGVDLKRFSPRAQEHNEEIARFKAKWGLDRFETILLSLGRIAPEKSVIELVEMTADYLRANPKTALLVVGDGVSLKDVRARVSQLGLEDQIIFTGLIPWEQVPNLYRLADLFVNNSSTETQGLTYIESIASGTPIVARYNECFDGIIENDVSGSLFTDAKDYIPMLEKLLGDKEFYLARVEAGINAASLVSTDSFVEAVLDSYKQAIAMTPRDS